MSFFSHTNLTEPLQDLSVLVYAVILLLNSLHNGGVVVVAVDDVVVDVEVDVDVVLVLVVQSSWCK